MTELCRGGRVSAIILTMTLAAGCASHRNDRTVINNAQEAHTELEPAVLDDSVLQAYMDKIGKRIVAEAREMHAAGEGPKDHKAGEAEWMFENVQFHMVGSPTLNAFTTGGQHIYIYSELFTTAETEDAFAAVCAHEFAHIYGRHVQKGMNRQYSTYAAAALAAVGGAAVAGKDNLLTGAAVGGAAGLGVGQFLGMGFTRADEDEADKWGFRFYTRAGWDPNRFADFFQQMIDKGYDKTPEIASDHPKLATRVENTKRRIEELPENARQWRKPNVASAREYDTLQARAKKLQRAMPQTKETQAAELMLSAFPSCVAPTATPRQQKARSVMEQAAKR
ncbi:MAG TPA: M48 family metalloprotease [Tepidisphaeraceae bacterium]|jgi:predicted Zn-dependent protease